MQTVRFLPRTILAVASACIAFGAIANANTWIVDINNGPGANFTQLTTAVAASVAGDVLIVRPGNYISPSQGQAINKGVTILGQGVVQFSNGNLDINHVPAGDVLVIVNLSAGSWFVGNSQGSITIRESKAQGGIIVTSCADVRIQSMNGFIRDVSVAGSRAEIADCTVNGSNGQGSCCWGFPGGNGTPGIYASSGSLVHLARSSVQGGSGGDTNGGPAYGGGGAPGVSVWNSELWIDGGGIASIKGGEGGYGEFCQWDGPCGAGVYNDNGMLIRSGANLQSTTSQGCGAFGPPVSLVGNATDQVLTPDAPTLEMTGNPVAGGMLTFTVHAPPGAVVRLNIGPTPQVLATPGTLVEALLIKLRSFDLGTVPPSGIVVKNLQIAAGWPQGLRQFAQARVFLTSLGQSPRSASALMVIR